jgi:hypothetical protein
VGLDAWARQCGCARVGLLVQYTTRRDHIAFSLDPPYFPTLYHKRHDFRIKFTEHKTCFNFLYNVSLKFFSFSEESARYCHQCENVFT